MTLTISHANAVHIHFDGLAHLDDLIPGCTPVFGSAPAAADGPMPALGTYWEAEAGFYGGTMPARNGQPAYHLVWSRDEAKDTKFGPYDHDVPGAVDKYDGLVNTTALLLDEKDHPAAQWVRTVMEPTGKYDWYLPAQGELMHAFIHVPQLFQKAGWYWSSTQYSRSYAFIVDVEYGNCSNRDKGGKFLVRAVRRVPLQPLSA